MADFSSEVTDMSDLAKEVTENTNLSKEIKEMKNLSKEVTEMSSLSKEVTEMSSLSKEVTEMSSLSKEVTEMADLSIESTGMVDMTSFEAYEVTADEQEDLENKPLIVGDKEVDLNKIFTPAPDAEEHIIKKDKKFEKTFASSAFYVPGVHPTVKEQMDLARAISKSLSDSSNHMSRGQSMYVNRKKRSVKWVHEGRGRNTSNTCSTPTPVANHDTAYRPPSSLRSQKTYPKSALKYSSNSIPRMEPFPVSPPTISLNNLEVPVPMAPTKLNDVFAAPKSPRMPLVCGPNFNVAPRGWGEMRDYYRPVALDGVGKTTLQYTDY